MAISEWLGSGKSSFYEKRYAMSYMDALPDFVKLSEGYGHLGIRLKMLQMLKVLLLMHSAERSICFLDFVTDPAENVFPMIAAGGGHSDMLLSGRVK